MNRLLRDLAPVSAGAWAQIEAEARRTLREMLAGRKLFDFNGPLGWNASAIETGRADRLDAPIAGVEARLLRVQPLLELRVPFELVRDELDAAGRGGANPDLDPVRRAARTVALAEDRAIFQGYDAADIEGIAEASAGDAFMLSENYAEYPSVVAEALNRLRIGGVDGPYGIVLSPRCFTGLTRTTHGGYPVMQHVRRLLDGPMVWSPGVDGAVVVSLRGGDFEIAVGRDLSIGYLEHSAAAVRLYIEESFTFRVFSPEAAVPLRYEKAAAGAA